MKIDILQDGSVQIFHKSHTVRIWSDRVTVDDLEVPVKPCTGDTYDWICEAAVYCFNERIFK